VVMRRPISFFLLAAAGVGYLRFWFAGFGESLKFNWPIAGRWPRLAGGDCVESAQASAPIAENREGESASCARTKFSRHGAKSAVV